MLSCHVTLEPFERVLRQGALLEIIRLSTPENLRTK